MIPQRMELSDIQQAFRELEGQMETLISRNVEMNGRRITGAGVSVSPFDYATRYELDKTQSALKVEIGALAPDRETALSQIKEVRIGTAAARPNASISNRQTVYFATDTYVMSYNADGTAWASWLFPALLQFLGTTNSFPALKRSATILQVRLADDSAYTDLEVLDEAYGSSFNGSVEVPTKNAVYDYIEAAWSTWTPTYSSDIGNAAATFAVAVTTSLASYRIFGKSVFVSVSYNSTLNAVTPAYIDLTLPGGVTPANNDTLNPAIVYNAIYETGLVQTVVAGTVLRVYRANLALYTAAANVGSRFSFTFQMT